MSALVVIKANIGHLALSFNHHTMSISNTDLNEIVNTDINTAPGVELTPTQKKHVGVVLDFFQAKPYLGKLNLFAENAVYEDAFASCNNRKEIGEYTWARNADGREYTDEILQGDSSSASR